MESRNGVEGKLRISEIFVSLQGEGMRLGVPSVFVRVSGCNLRCIWCDTPYASWNPEGDILNLKQIVEQIKSYQVQDVVVTGGEPMLFDAVENLVKTLQESDHFITIETAGTIFRRMDVQLMSISPKLANSTPVAHPEWASRHEKIRLNRQPLLQLINEYDFQLKFVVDPFLEGDIAEIESILKELPSLRKDQVLLMPEGRDREELLKKARLLVPICIEKGWRLAPRYQVDLFGDTRGT